MNTWLFSGCSERARNARSPLLRRGFTLVEVLLALAIVGTLVSIALPRLDALREQGQYTAAVGDVRRIESEVLAYLAANRELPADLATLALDSLLDPWGRPYAYLPHYTTPPTSQADLLKKPHGARIDQFLKPLNNDFDLYSLGPDGLSAPPLRAGESVDDVVRAVGGAFIGKAKDF